MSDRTLASAAQLIAPLLIALAIAAAWSTYARCAPRRARRASTRVECLLLGACTTS